jgi:hypothetical protein
MQAVIMPVAFLARNPALCPPTMRASLPRLAVLIGAAALLANCGGSPDERKTDGEAALAAKAVADVDGAMADARGVAPQAPPAPAK